MQQLERGPLQAELAMHFRDTDPAETAEWLEALDQLVDSCGIDRAHFILTALLKRAQIDRVRLPALVQSPYINTIPTAEEPDYPGDEEIELRIRRYIRWNAVAMVMRANKKFPGIGGHLSTYASAATLYEVGFNHFFRGRAHGGGDQVFFQGHASPGIYARAYLEGRISEAQLLGFRQETRGGGLASYPHPWLMPDFWEFPTVSMGLGPLSAIYQARYNRYLQARGFGNYEDSRVWAFVGDGETGEPETLGSLHLANREGLGNLIFVVNCNLQRLDGPVRGNGKIIQELEAVFHGAGWNVIKVIWGRNWDHLLEMDKEGHLIRRMGEVVDGAFQKFSVESGAYAREHFFGVSDELRRMVEHLSDEDIRRLRRGGHDFRKVYAAYNEAIREVDRPTAILAKTVKGWTLGEGAEGRNVAHQAKKLGLRELKVFRDRMDLDVPDEQLNEPPFVKFEEGSEELEYLRERRDALGGYLPRRTVVSYSIPTPQLDWFKVFLTGSRGREVSSTMAFARLLALLMDDDTLGDRVVPIIPDEARTFGLDTLFNKYGIYSQEGMLYESVDAGYLLSYRMAKDGQVLQEGICEAGSMASFIAAATSYCTHGVPMLPFYIFYSMFGYQRVGDQIWAATDQRARGFLLGATAGRTTLQGEGLQHCDGHSLLLASISPHTYSYDPAWAYEMAVIIQDGMERILTDEDDRLYYITVYNETYEMPDMPPGVEKGILDGMYLFKAAAKTRKAARAQLFGSGSILREVLRAQNILAGYNVAADVWSVTSYHRLRLEALVCERRNMFHPTGKRRVPLVARLLKGKPGPVIAASDWIRAVPDQISRWVPNGLLSLGTDGLGRSDTREALRHHFEVDAEHIALATVSQLAARGKIEPAVVTTLIEALGLDPKKPDPTYA